MPRLLLLLAFFLCNTALFAQSLADINPSTVFDPNIRTVQLLAPASPLPSLPIVSIRTGNGALLLEFDHIGDALKDYLYSIQHCNSDWQPSELEDNEYINGFTEERITEFSVSRNTLTQYTHYTLSLPNAGMRWTKSGNYLLKVYDNDGDEKQLVLVRRFLVSESAWSVQAQFVQPAKVEKLNTHHEIDFAILPRSTRIFNLENDVKAFVLQNGRWDNALGPLHSNFTRGDKLAFDYQDKVVFPAGKEWRWFDMRSFDYRGDQVRRIDEYDDYYAVTLYMDDPRAGHSYIYRSDINGRFIIGNSNPNRTPLECDYAKVLFSLKQKAPSEESDVYVFGELTDWRIQPEFKMHYEAEVGAYVCEPWLKQGYYNYEFVAVNPRTGAIDDSAFEGDWYETGNYYTILTYFRPFGERYDRLMATTTMDSKKN